MGDGTIGNVGMAAGMPANRGKAPQIKKETVEKVIKDTFTVSQEKIGKTAGKKGKTNHIENARNLIKSALKQIDEAKPDMVDAEKYAGDSMVILQEMDPHVKNINLDFIGRDVSQEGTAVRGIGDKFSAKASKGESETKEAKSDMKPVKGHIENALKELEQSDNSDRFLGSAKWELENSLTWLDYADREIIGAERNFEQGKSNIGEMKPYLDIVEMDTVETDVGRFARDLKELKSAADEDMLDAKLQSKFGGETLDSVKKYLNNALKYLEKEDTASKGQGEEKQVPSRMKDRSSLRTSVSDKHRILPGS
ncbi:MAG: hypothetical protein K8T10_15300 [Candidatus Eremiobacteraeota bacterium]|nr:hypothetical protein [Candidatus Eremiobacteraeota bacterium]